MVLKKQLLLLITLMLLTGFCSDNDEYFEQQIFTLLSPNQTNLNFVNKVVDSDSLNILDYMYFYNGGGVAVGDLNNDGLDDIYFVANQHENALYLNKGNLEFEDITTKAGLKGYGNWKTGVTLVDINNDGWLDIYLSVVNDGEIFKGKNQLYINNKDMTFTDKAEKYGLNFEGYSTQAAFFDYDKDGDLDCYILTHSVHNNESYGYTNIREIKNELSGDHLYRNDNNYFKDVTEKAGINMSAIGYGLGLAIADFNNDGWEDIYVSNDFFENDYYYLNQKNGTFKEMLKTAFGHTSLFSMGNTTADLNKDGYTDIITTDMLPNSMYFIKSTVMEPSYDDFLLRYELDYFYQLSKNCVQINVGAGEAFKDVSLQMNMSSTDWTWSPLVKDFNLDGKAEVFFASGIQKRPNDIDYIKYHQNSTVNKMLNKSGKKYDLELIAELPDGAINNYLFKQQSNGFSYEEISQSNDMSQYTYPSGVVAADLDNDGDLDIVVNNSNSTASLYQNISLNNNYNKNRKYFNLKFQFKKPNLFAIGTQVYVKTNQGVTKKSLQTSDAFQSSSTNLLEFALGEDEQFESAMVVWPDLSFQIIHKINFNTTSTITYYSEKVKDARQSIEKKIEDYIHGNKKKSYEKWEVVKALKTELNEEIDFNVNYLLPHIYSKYTPPIVVEDFNNDNLKDVFVGSFGKKVRKIVIQNDNGYFEEKQLELIDSKTEPKSIDGYAISCDINFDGWNDIIVSNYAFGNKISKNKPSGRIYINKKNMTFKELTLPSTQYPVDYIFAYSDSSERKTWLFVINKKEYQNFDKPTGNYIIEVGKDAKPTIIDPNEYTHFYQKKYISDIAFLDFDKDKKMDIVVASEWSKPIIYLAKEQFSKPHNLPKIGESFGLWQSANSISSSVSGQTKYLLLGNWGMNTKFLASKKNPLRMYLKDLDDNKKTDIIISYEFDGKYYPFRPKFDLENELPFIKKEYLSYRKMADKTTEEIFGDRLNKTPTYKVNTLETKMLSIDKDSKVSKISLPDVFQQAPVRDCKVIKETDESYTLLLNGNLVGVIPYEGRYDAMGLLLVELSKQKRSITQVQYMLCPELNGKEICYTYPMMNSNQELVIVALTHEGELLFMKKSK